jgi:hypothetical protein
MISNSRSLRRPGFTAAANYATAAVEFLSDTDANLARLYRTQARLLEGPGEPLTRVVVWIDQARYELDELPEVQDVQMNLAIE